jgi:hypothetical protein
MTNFMKRSLVMFATLLPVAAFFSGCESMSKATTKVRDTIAAREQPRTHLYKAGQRATYEAAKTAVDQMGFKFVRGGPARGELEAVSGVASGDTLRSSRQIVLKLKLSAMTDDTTEAGLVLSEVIEADSSGRAGMGTATQLKDTPLYEVFFRNVQLVMDSPKK